MLEHQEKLYLQKSDLQSLLEACKGSTASGGNENSGIASACVENWARSFEWDRQADDIRMNVFGIPTYRINQQEIINAVMSGKDVIVIMAAGGGKSLCYQLPALLRSGTSLVVSPLLSLIQDQVMGLVALGIPASMLTSTTSKEEEKSIYKVLEKGEGELRVLYVTPEKISKSKRFMSKLEKCNHAGRLSLIAIDEAHCCSQWGHDFRPDYKNLGILKTQFPKVPMIALTATATQRVQEDLKEMLHISRCVKFVSSVNRPNLFYEVREKSSNGMAVIDDIADFIHGSYQNKESGIVYCFTRKECEQVGKELRQRGISAEHYHADMDAKTRERVHIRWSSNKIQVIVGTVAFGMGINKPDVRFVIHHSLSKSLETYYQESGRAGRDGLPSHCLLYFRPADLPRQSSMVFYEHAGLQNLYAIARFCQSKRTCRRAAFFRHFGESLQECNGMCDNCAFSKEIKDVDVTPHARSLLSLVKEMQSNDQRATLLQLVDNWKTKHRKEGTNVAASELSKDLKKEDVEQMIIQLLLDGALKEEFQHTAYATNAYLALGSMSKQLLQGQKVVRLEMVQGSKANSQNIKKGALFDNNNTHSGLALVLDELRKELSQRHGSIFPHAVLSSQHITMLCSQQPTTRDEIEKLLGKRKAEQYGKEVLQCIKTHAFQNPESTSGQWVSPKKKKVLQDDNCNKTTEKKVLKAKRTFVCVSSSDDESKGHDKASDDADFHITPTKTLKNT
ncbi:ATP-dependent DNA helicase Q-like 2 isoform X2 [Cryptomeria japonica]|nr:ATP-dependent DNA helicase Q-like 2 isoform X2 [Cryptomeria japonica]